MTREQAIEIWRRETQYFGGGGPIEALVALGVLKLDEPKTVLDKFIKAFQAIEVSKRSHWDQVLGAIDKAGLRIVEK